MPCAPITTRRHRGFSLLEMLTAMMIFGVMAALSIAALSGLKNRGNFVSATGDLIGGLRLARAEAYSRQAPCVFVIDTANGRWWTIANIADNFSLSAFNPATPAVSPDVLLASGTLPTGVTFGPSGTPGGYGAPLPQPYAGVPSYSGSSPAPSLPYCSFCASTGAASNPGFGSITFYGTGSAVFSVNTGTPIGHSFTIQGPQRGSAGFQVMTFAVVARTGAAATFETSL